MLTIYLICHGQTEASLEPIFCGDTETPLTEVGRQQASELGHCLYHELEHTPTFAISSTLSRAEDTLEKILQWVGTKGRKGMGPIKCIEKKDLADALASKHPSTYMREDRLRDRCVGSLRYKRYDDPRFGFTQQSADEYLTAMGCDYPGMETFTAMEERTLSFVKELVWSMRQSGQENPTALVVNHRETNRFLLKALRQCDELPLAFGENCACIKVVLDDDGNYIGESNMREEWDI